MTTADFRPTHVVPQDGLPAWEAPDVNRPTAPLDALLPVDLVDRLGDWGRIVCANGWTAWVDSRLLIAVPRDPPAAGHPLTRTADPGPLLARAEEALGRYRRAAQELSTGAGDGAGEAFRRRTRGLRVGVVVDGESMWLYDAEHERWVYCDGTRLSTYAAGEGPSVHGYADGADGVDGVNGVDGVDGTRAVVPDPTQVVEAVSDPGADAREGAGPGSVRVVEAVADPGADAGDGEGPGSTRVVEAVSDPGADGGEGEGPGSARVVEAGSAPGVDARDGEGAEPTQVVEAVPDSGPAPDPYGEDATRRIPPVTVDPDPDPQARSGDG